MAESKSVKPASTTDKDGDSKPTFSGTSKAETVEVKNDDPNTTQRYPTPQDEAAATGNVGYGHGDVNPVTATVDEIKRADVDTDEQERISKLPPVKVYNPNAGLRPRVGGPYLDNLELEEAERQRAIKERRAPDYTNMAGTAGVPLMTAGQVANLHGGDPALADFITANADNDKLGPTPIGEVPFHGTNLDVVEVSLDEQRQRLEWDNTKVTSHDQPDVVYVEPVEKQKK